MKIKELISILERYDGNLVVESTEHTYCAIELIDKDSDCVVAQIVLHIEIKD